MPTLHAETWPVIDYRAHPAFGRHERATSPAFEQDVEAHILELNDALRASYSATQCLPETELEPWLESRIGAPVDKLRQACAAALPADPAMAQCVDAALRATRDDARSEAAFRNRLAGASFHPRSPVSRAALRDLTTNSISIGHIEDGQILAIVKELRPQMALLRSSDTARRGTRSWRVLPRAGSYWRLLNEALQGLGYLEATDAFYGCEMQLLSVNLVYSHDREVWWRDCYRDVGLPTSPAAYFHHDQDWHQIKAVLYLNPATRESGAFSYIEGGQHFRRGNVLAHFYFHLVHAMDRAAAKSNTGRVGYYRRGFTDPALRASFAALPRVLQGATHFGDDLLEDNPQTASLLARERRVESSSGNIVLFNGGDLLHRGGLVQRGERWSLQLMFGPRVTRAEHLRTRVQHLALVAAGRAIGWRRLDQLRALRRRVS